MVAVLVTEIHHGKGIQINWFFWSFINIKLIHPRLDCMCSLSRANNRRFHMSSSRKKRWTKIHVSTWNHWGLHRVWLCSPRDWRCSSAQWHFWFKETHKKHWLSRHKSIHDKMSIWSLVMLKAKLITGKQKADDWQSSCSPAETRWTDSEAQYTDRCLFCDRSLGQQGLV